MAVQRVSPERARASVESGDALLVCAYDDEKKCESVRLEGALTMAEFRERMPSLKKSQHVIFYCG
jgi:hypothetical protein